MRETPGIYETDENGEGNGIVHWFCSYTHRAASDEAGTFGEDVAPEGTACEICGRDVDTLEPLWTPA